MIFVGDIAIPQPGIIDDSSINRIQELFTGKTVIGNLEGSLCSECHGYSEEDVVFNAESALPILRKWNIKAVSLANNHILDIPGSLASTKQTLSHYNIESFGAGKNLEKASEPVEIRTDIESITILGFGWEAIQCPLATDRSEGVNPLKYDHVIKSVKKARADYPENLLIVMMHWNYELEHYPQPAERQLAKYCIDLGVDAVIGGHSHLAQGIEMYNGAPIVYSLGNWAFPNGVYFSGKLGFPEKSNLQLAFEWNSSTNQYYCHWFDYISETNEISHITSEEVTGSERVKRLTPFAGMDHDTYRNWFKKNRNKKKLLPIFKEMRSQKRNQLKTEYVKMRGLMIELMLELNLKKIKNN